MLRRHWAGTGFGKRAIWQGRKAGPGITVLDPLAEPDALARAAAGADVILCLAGVTGGDPAALALNSALAEAAIGAAADTGADPGTRARVLLTSSAAVYGAALYDESNPDQTLFREDTPLTEHSALSQYGRAKLEMEQRGARMGADLGVPVTALRIGNVAGADAILGGWRPGFQLDRFRDGRTPRRSYVGPVTLARMLGDLAAASVLPPVLNVAAPGVVEMGALLDAAGLEWTPRVAGAAAIGRVALDVQALGAFTALDPGDSLPEGLVSEWRQSGPDLT